LSLNFPDSSNLPSAFNVTIQRRTIGLFTVTPSEIHFHPFCRLHVHNVNDELDPFKPRVWPLNAITDLTKKPWRRYRDVGLEIEFNESVKYEIRSAFFAFRQVQARDDAYSKLLSQSKLKVTPLSTYTDRWNKYLISNYEYLIALNNKAGRTFNDLCQYPVFPWVLNAYDITNMDIYEPKMYRNLTIPMRAMDKFRLDQLNESNAKNNNIVASTGHFSDPAQIAKMLGVTYAINSNEKLKNINDEWKKANNDKNNFSELIPEFYSSDTFLQSRLDHFENKLPQWTRNCDEFLLTMRAALENKFVSKGISQWIDITFGYKQNQGNNIYNEVSNDSDDGDLPLRYANDKALLPIRAYTPVKIFSDKHEERLPSMEMVIIDKQKNRFKEQLETLEEKQSQDKKKLLFEIETLKKQLDKLSSEKQESNSKETEQRLRAKQLEMEEQFKQEREKMKQQAAEDIKKINSKHEEELANAAQQNNQKHDRTQDLFNREHEQLKQELESQKKRHQREIEELRLSAQENALLVNSKLQEVELAAKTVSESHSLERDRIISETEQLMKKLDLQYQEEKEKQNRERETATKTLDKKHQKEKEDHERQLREENDKLIKQKLHEEKQKHDAALDQLLSQILSLKKELDALKKAKAKEGQKLKNQLESLQLNRNEENEKHEKTAKEKNKLQEKLLELESNLQKEKEGNEKLQEHLRVQIAKNKLLSPKVRPPSVQSSVETNQQKKIDQLNEKIAELSEQNKLLLHEKRNTEQEYKKQLLELKKHVNRMETDVNMPDREILSQQMQKRLEDLMSENRQLRITLHVYETKYSDQVRMKEKTSLIDKEEEPFPNMYVNVREGGLTPRGEPDKKELKKPSPATYAKQGKARAAYEKILVGKVEPLDLSSVHGIKKEEGSLSVPTPKVRRNTISDKSDGRVTPRNRAHSAKPSSTVLPEGFISPRSPSVLSPR
jgi:hypothetical protein